MAKKEQSPASPEITVLPMSGGDSPMVIDLPDGQKLIVSNLAAGSVIEVATWRGTGRPDSRTTRLMLGMTSGQTKPAEGAESESKEPSLSKFALVLNRIVTLFFKLRSKMNERKKTLTEKKSKAPLIEKVVPPTRMTQDAEVDDWINSILEKSAKKKSEVKKEPAKAPVKKTPVKKAAQKKATKKATSGRAR